jgi:hypothetical protein
MGLTKPRASQIYNLDYKQATRAVAVSNINLSGGAPNQVDGVNLSANDRILVTGQITGSQNGIYYVVNVGSGSNGTWARGNDANDTGEIDAGTIVMVTEGIVYADTQWKLITNDPITIGTTPLTFVQNYSANSISGGTSNVTVYSNANVTISSAGTANVLTVSSTGVVVTGTTSATGNITGSNLLTGGLISATSTITSAANITGGNILTSGLISSTGNAILGNVLTGGNITGGNLAVTGTTISTGGSLSFNGSNTYLSTPSSSQFNLGTSDFTIEFWFNGPNQSNYVFLYDNRNAAVGGGPHITLGQSSSVLRWGPTGLAGSTFIGDNNWHHCAVTRQSGIIKLWVDGALDNSGSDATNYNTTENVLIGSNSYSAPQQVLTGYLTSYRVVVGTAVYTSNFTPSTAPLTAISGTVLLLDVANSGAYLTDSSTNNFTITNNNAVTYVTSTPFNPNQGGLITGSTVSVTGNITGTTGAFGTGTVTLGNIVNGNGNGVGNIGSSITYFNTVFARATSALYAPGTVVDFGGDQEITISTASHSTRVAGIISTNPSYLMNSTLECINALEVALVGRVPCRVVGTISKGDRLVASNIPGVATVLDPTLYEPGCIIGKALESYDSIVDGIIEVAVGRF